MVFGALEGACGPIWGPLALEVGDWTTLGNLTEPSAGMYLCSIRKSMAFLEQYCLASFFLVKDMVGSPKARSAS